MTDVIALVELSDEPVVHTRPGWTVTETSRSPRLEAVLDRCPSERVRIRRGLDNMGIYSVKVLLATDDDRFMRAKNLGPRSREYIDAALAAFGLHRVGVNPPVVVRDGASADEAHCQRLRKWIEERMAWAEEREIVDASPPDQTIAANTERDVLADVMLILDGREPKNERRW